MTNQADPHSTPSMAFVGEIMMEVMRRRKKLDPREAGLFSYYEARYARGETFTNYARQIARSILDHGAGADQVVEIGAGLGELPFLLAAEGIPACAVERNGNRVDAIKEFHKALSSRFHGFAKLGRYFAGSFPCSIPGVDPARTLLISAGLVFTASDEEEEATVNGMLEYGSVIVDVATLVRHRPDVNDWPAVERRFTDAGFRELRVITENRQMGNAKKVIWYVRD